MAVFNMLILSFLIPSLGYAQNLPSAKELYLSSTQNNTYRLSSFSELQKLESLFLCLLQADFHKNVYESAQNLGFDLRKCILGQYQFMALVEKEKHKHGRGFYLFSLKGTGSLLMLPHRFYDKYTGRIGLMLLSSGQFRAGAWNSIHRYAYKRGQASQPTDWAHIEDTPFTALTRAFARICPEDMLIQVHGFNPDKRKSMAGSQAQVIVSNGGPQPSWLKSLGIDLRKKLGLRVLTYPAQVQELGGTTNISGQILRSMGQKGFMHLELNSDLRKKIKNDYTLCTKLAKILSEVRP